MLWLIRIVLLNGLGVLATWLFVLTCFSIADVLLYRDSFGESRALEISKGDIKFIKYLIIKDTG